MKDFLQQDITDYENVKILHLYLFEISNLDGTNPQTVAYTDSDIYVEVDGIEYIPMLISFDNITENVTMESDTTTITIDNINSNLTSIVLTKQWHKNPIAIARVIYREKPTTINGSVYDTNYGNYLNGYPKINLDTDVLQMDKIILFRGILDNISANEGNITIKATNQLINWNKPFPYRTFSQNEFTSVSSVITQTLYWGVDKPYD